MPKSRSVSTAVSGETVSIDVNYAQELVEFWTQKYERVKEELDRVRGAPAATSLSPQESSSDEDEDEDEEGEGEEGESGSSSVTEYEEESELDRLKACNEDLKNQLAASEKRHKELLQQIQGFFAQNAALALEADALRQQKINSIYPPTDFLPAGAAPPTLRFTSPQALYEELSTGTLSGRRIYFVERPPYSLPLWVTACGLHGYWFSPVVTYPQDVEFELVVEGKASEWTYLGRYRSVHLPGWEMRLSEWLALDDETKRTHCIRTAAQRLGRGAATPATVSITATELRKQYESVHIELQGAATRTRKRKFSGRARGNSKRFKGEPIREM